MGQNTWKAMSTNTVWKNVDHMGTYKNASAHSIAEFIHTVDQAARLTQTYTADHVSQYQACSGKSRSMPSVLVDRSLSAIQRDYQLLQPRPRALWPICKASCRDLWRAIECRVTDPRELSQPNTASFLPLILLHHSWTYLRHSWISNELNLPRAVDHP